MYENANRRLAAWGLVFAAFPEMVIIYRLGRIHSNVDPLSRLPRVPGFVSPTRHDLPSMTLSTEHEELQLLWHNFIKERELTMDSLAVTTRAQRTRLKQKESSMLTNSSPPTSEHEEACKAQKTCKPQRNAEDPNTPPNLHVYASDETVNRIIEGYKTDNDFAPMIACTIEEPQDIRKHCAY